MIVRIEPKDPITLFFRRPVVVDGCFATLLLAWCALPLLALRGSPWLHDTFFLLGVGLVFLLLICAWTVLSKRWAPGPEAVTRSTLLASQPYERLTWLRTMLSCALLLLIAVVCYYLPLRIHFWLGMDEYMAVGRESPLFWSDLYDRGWGRPLGTAWFALARLFPGHGIEKFLGLGLGLCFANAVLLWRIVGRMFPGSGCIPLAAAILLIVDPAEKCKFFALYAANSFAGDICLLLLGVWLFLYSYDRKQPWALVASCAALGASLLFCEGIFPLALLVPVLLWSQAGKDGGRRFVWISLWMGTVLLQAVRFLVRLVQLKSGSYQAHSAQEMLKHPEMILRNFGKQVGSLGSYFELSRGISPEWGYGILALILVLALLWLGIDFKRHPGRRRFYVAGLVLAVFALLLGHAPFALFPVAFHTRFLAAPGQALLLAFGLGLIGSFFGRRIGQVLVAVGVALLAANATVSAFYSQTTIAAASQIRFEKSASIFQQLNVVAPGLAPDTVVLLLVDDRESTPLGRLFDAQLSCTRMCGVTATVASIAPSTVQPDQVISENHDNIPVTFTREGIHSSHYLFPVMPDGSICLTPEQHFYAYRQMVAFRLTADGSLAFLQHLPSQLLPAGCSAEGYEPLARLQAAPIEHLPFMEYTSWMQRPYQVFDARKGILLGQNWSPLECRYGEICRRGDDGAEILVNPAGHPSVTIPLDLECADANPDRTSDLEVVDVAGRVVATTRVTGRQRVEITLPTDATRIALFRFQLRGGQKSDTDSAAGHGFRVYCSNPCVPGHWQLTPGRLLMDYWIE